MNLRRLATVALVAGALAGTASPAAATCYIGQVEICDKPTDPYTEPVVDAALDIVFAPPVGPVVGTAMGVYADVYKAALCAVEDYWWC